MIQFDHVFSNGLEPPTRLYNDHLGNYPFSQALSSKTPVVETADARHVGFTPLKRLMFVTAIATATWGASTHLYVTDGVFQECLD